MLRKFYLMLMAFLGVESILRYYSALTVYELLMDKCYLGLHSHIDSQILTDNDIQDIRNRIFREKIVKQIKITRLNSNWDMLFIVFSIHLINIEKVIT